MVVCVIEFDSLQHNPSFAVDIFETCLVENTLHLWLPDSFDELGKGSLVCGPKTLEFLHEFVKKVDFFSLDIEDIFVFFYRAVAEMKTGRCFG